MDEEGKAEGYEAHGDRLPPNHHTNPIEQKHSSQLGQQSLHPGSAVPQRLSRMDTSTISSRSAHSGLRTRSQGPRRPNTTRDNGQSGGPQKPPRSNSVTRVNDEKARSEAEDARRREQADAAFLEWLKRKIKAPREPKCSPTREQLEQHAKADARQRMLNQWHAKFPRSKSRSGLQSPDTPSIRYDATI